jgi:hypothetical protein
MSTIFFSCFICQSDFGLEAFAACFLKIATQSGLSSYLSVSSAHQSDLLTISLSAADVFSIHMVRVSL